MTAPGLPPHLCHEQRGVDHCKKQHRRLHEKNKNGRPPATMAQGCRLSTTLRRSG